ncbi:MAG TPA: hypothetical protein VHC73_02390 [Vitreimonas sp.]|jgi:hypothetical protein|nr:hypothetical protein [Vitreimonas sp.]
MTLDQLYALSPTIAALALVVSLIYASLQFRINTRVARNARLVAAASVVQDFSRLLASSADCARIFRDGLEDLAKLDPVERWRFGSMMQMLIANSQLVLELENVGYQDYFHTRSMHQIMRRPGARQWWARESKMFASATVASVNAILAAEATPPAGEPSD